MIPQLLQQIKDLASSVRKSNALNINSKAIKEKAVAIGSYYFKDCRDEVSRILDDKKALSKLDEEWQQLIRLAHGNNAKKSYLSLLKKLQKKTTNLAIATHASYPNLPSSGLIQINYSDAEQILIKTLDELVPTAAQSYRQGIEDLTISTDRFSYRGTACEFREALRETLDLLAPDKEVSIQPWFKQDQNTSGPTMKQKVRFILSSRGKSKAQRASAEKSVDLIESLYGDVARAVYTRASLSTHVQTTKNEVFQMKRYLDAVMFDLLEIGQKE
jgi:hypothetical protein